MSNLSRRTLVASAAALPALTVPAFASTATDPIFAAIEAHRRTTDRWMVHVRRDWELQDQKIEFDDPRRVAIEQKMTVAADVEHEASVKLVDVEPTSLAGVIALLSYFAENEVKDGGSGSPFPDMLYDDDDPAINKDWGAPYSYFLTRTVTRALRKLTAAA
jgi:hypothetical protein